MSHKKIVVSIFWSLLCFLGSMTTAWADNGESDYRDEDNVPAEAYEGEYAPENSYSAQEYYPENQGEQGYYPENQEYYPENQEYYPENQEYYPENQEYYPENQEYYPENQEYYPENQEYYPENQEYYPENQGNSHEEVPENEALSVEARSWEEGFDMRWHLGLSVFFRDTGSSRRYMERGVGLDLSGEMGYRWKYGGIYLKAGMVALDNVEVNPEIDAGKSSSTFMELVLLGKFYIPLVNNWELVLDAGITIALDANVGVGANYHIGDMTLGFECIYQHISATYEGAYVNAHLLMGTFVIGYTF